MILHSAQEFNAQGAAANMTCQLVASISVCLPTCFAYVSGAHHFFAIMCVHIGKAQSQFEDPRERTDAKAHKCEVKEQIGL